MGKITVMGKSEREIEVDIMEIIISFLANEDSAAEASKKVNAQCEHFLENLKNSDFDIKTVRMIDENISQTYKNNVLIVSAEKVIAIKYKLDLGVANFILNIIQDNKYDVNYNITYEISNLQSIHEDLLKEAVNDSRKKAEMIAKTMDQKITGIDTANMRVFGACGASDDYYLDSMAIFEKRSSKTLLSDMLEAPKKTESESIEVVWIME